MNSEYGDQETEQRPMTKAEAGVEALKVYRELAVSLGQELKEPVCEPALEAAAHYIMTEGAEEFRRMLKRMGGEKRLGSYAILLDKLGLKR